jgi:hypothetical protein
LELWNSWGFFNGEFGPRVFFFNGCSGHKPFQPSSCRNKQDSVVSCLILYCQLDHQRCKFYLYCMQFSLLKCCSNHFKTLKGHTIYYYLWNIIF